MAGILLITLYDCTQLHTQRKMSSISSKFYEAKLLYLEFWDDEASVQQERHYLKEQFYQN